MEHHENGVVNGRQEHEEALLALVEHRTREVKHLRYYISYYTSQVRCYSRIASCCYVEF